MKKLLQPRVLVVLLACAVGLLSGATASASGKFMVSDSDDATISASETVDGSVYLVGPIIEVDGTVDGDIYCAGDSIVINGTVNGDVICAGATITLDGIVNGDVRLAASDISLAGTVSGNAGVLASTVTSKDNFSLGGDMSGAADKMSLGGVFGRDVAVAATDLKLSGDVTRNVSANTQDISLASQSSIGGDLWYKSNQQTNTDSNVVSGNTTHVPQERDQPGQNLWAAVIGVLMIVALATLAVLVAPRYVHTAASQPVRNVLLAFLVGITVTLLMPVVAFVFLVSTIGLLFGVALFLVWLLLLTMSFAFASYYVGGLVLQKRATNAVLVALVGGFVLGILIVIPFLGAFVVLAAVAVGVGMQVMHLKYQFSKNPYTIAS